MPPAPVRPASDLAAWRVHPSSVDWVEQFESGGQIGRVLVSDLAASGVPVQVIRAWSAARRGEDDDADLPPSDPVWLAMSLVTLSWHHPHLGVAQAARWALVVGMVGTELLAATDDWATVGFDRAWAYLAAGMSPAEVLAVRETSGQWPDVQGAATLAALRGVALPGL